VPKAEDIVNAMKWIAKEKMKKDLDLDASIKITFYVISRCSDTQCYHSFDSFSIERVEGAEVVDWIRNIDERSWEKVVVVIPKKFVDAFIELRHENEYGVHYHAIYRTGIIDPNVVNGWIERIVYRKDP